MPSQIKNKYNGLFEVMTDKLQEVLYIHDWNSGEDYDIWGYRVMENSPPPTKIAHYVNTIRFKRFDQAVEEAKRMKKKIWGGWFYKVIYW